MDGDVWLDCRYQFRYVPWAALHPGDVVYYLIPGPDREWAHGPFTVVDPATCRLCNGQGVELRLPRVLPLLPAASGRPDAAPDLLAACEAIVAGWGHQDGVSRAVGLARAAIAKARGG